MPELPDLEVFSRNLTKKLKGKVLVQINVLNQKKLNVPVEKLKGALEGQLLKKVIRVGKELHFEFENKHTLGLHLMLHGQLFFTSKQNDQKYIIIELLFDEGTGLVLTDFQSAATPTLDPVPNEVPDALNVEFIYLKQKLGATRTPIKTVLLDQHVLRGIGNAYADEVLWDARISPFSAANKLPEATIKALIKSITSVLENAEKQILKTHPDIITGEVRDFLEVHQPKRKQTSTGATIHQQPVGSRKTYYTDEQELFN